MCAIDRSGEFFVRPKDKPRLLLSEEMPFGNYAELVNEAIRQALNTPPRRRLRRIGYTALLPKRLIGKACFLAVNAAATVQKILHPGGDPVSIAGQWRCLA